MPDHVHGHYCQWCGAALVRISPVTHEPARTHYACPRAPVVSVDQLMAQIIEDERMSA